ncbi:hypothetical protein L228DRAFT_248803 [Xylona heveae TC161]|uniref:Secreted peptide n=1 Tax=Xylona heveae (strain CBS 132557 / TC161) TaxID=1328760 RepID=A0A165FJG3_XYLHT|nr:hypothetical protein L228DRAFT_248803 [Xylona heveae TC161]KZF21046.1 hypothetical protein L228DRAFT_248803 [Xylona heveae TC161]
MAPFFVLPLSIIAALIAAVPRYQAFIIYASCNVYYMYHVRCTFIMSCPVSHVRCPLSVSVIMSCHVMSSIYL